MIKVTQDMVNLLETIPFSTVHCSEFHCVMFACLRIFNPVDSTHSTLCHVSQYAVVPDAEIVFGMGQFIAHQRASSSLVLGFEIVAQS